MPGFRLRDFFHVHAICRICQLGEPFLNDTAAPYPSRENNGLRQKKVVIQYFDAIGKRYDLADTLMSFGLHFFWRRAALKHLAGKKRHRVLDLCGGAGEFARRIAGTGNAGMTVVCDLSRSMLAAEKRRAAEKKCAGDDRIRRICPGEFTAAFQRSCDGVFRNKTGICI